MEITVSRLVRVSPETLSAALTPAALLEFEGWTTSDLVEDADDEMVLRANPGGRLIAPRFVFERRENGFTYRQADRRLVTVETTIEWTAAGADDATEVRARARIDPSVPIPVLASLLGWKRRRDLVRVLDRIEAAVA